MRRFFGFIGFAVILMAIFFVVNIVDERYGSGVKAVSEPLNAGFARVKITPPDGTPMTGFSDHDGNPSGSRGVHDDLYARALYLTQGQTGVFIIGLDLFALSREEADRFRGALGRALGLAPDEIFLNTSHTHSGPKTGSWRYASADPLYLERLEKTIISAASTARNSARPASLFSGTGVTKLPMSQRLKTPAGTVDFRPNPSGTVCNTLPVLLVKGDDGKPICLLFSAACHPSTVRGEGINDQISSDYPGAAAAKLDAWLGAPVSFFLQGAGGDAKPGLLGTGGTEWRNGTWADVDAAGTALAAEVRGVIAKGLAPVEPGLKTASVLMEFPLAASPGRSGFEEVLRNPKAHTERAPEVMKLWAKEQLARISRGDAPLPSVGITLHGIRLGTGLRIVGIEAEPVGALGNLMEKFYAGGVVFPLGYTDGARMYLPATPMLSEGGYEVENYREYHLPAPLAGGIEKVLTSSLEKLRAAGID